MACLALMSFFEVVLWLAIPVVKGILGGKNYEKSVFGKDVAECPGSRGVLADREERSF